jgi:SnoaL-like domain
MPGDWSDYISITQLIERYTMCIDSADFESFGELFRHGEWNGRRGAEECREYLRSGVILYEDGTPRTRHHASSPVITVLDDDTAEAESFATVFQQVQWSDPITPIAVLHYQDVFWRPAGTWAFRSRVARLRLSTGQERHFRNLNSGLRQ